MSLIKHATRAPVAPRYVLVLLYVGFICGGGAIGGLALSILTPIDDDPATAVALGAIIGLFSGLIAASGVHGALTMRGGWWSLIPGVGVGTAMFGFVAAAEVGSVWLWIGAAGFVLALVGFYLLGMVSKTIPRSTVESYGSPASLIAGVVLLVVGIASDSMLAFILGLGFSTVGATILITRLVLARAARAAARESEQR
ncbi:hypothetical protein ACO2Q7_14630 [Rathayibacter sp. KR2-224]|uniref:hypothetical protein n=1 Tax=Rathayibacter sp. KR2-224 TaxID=3400913 RepID=UPI003BFFBBD7